MGSCSAKETLEPITSIVYHKYYCKRTNKYLYLFHFDKLVKFLTMYPEKKQYNIFVDRINFVQTFYPFTPIITYRILPYNEAVNAYHHLSWYIPDYHSMSKKHKDKAWVYLDIDNKEELVAYIQSKGVLTREIVM